jgi:hypothetical protein
MDVLWATRDCVAQEVRLPAAKCLAVSPGMRHCSSCCRGVAVLCKGRQPLLCHPPHYQPRRWEPSTAGATDGATTEERLLCVQRFDDRRLVSQSRWGLPPVTRTHACIGGAVRFSIPRGVSPSQ